MKSLRRFKFGPLTSFTLLSFFGSMFFVINLLLVWIYTDEVNEFLADKFNKTSCNDLLVFVIMSAINAVGLLLTFLQLLLAKPTSRKVLIPVVFFTTTAFATLIALDFFLEVQLSHVVTPKEQYTAPGKKGKSRFKTGYLIIYVCMCIVAGFMYLAYKDYVEYLENQNKGNESNEIVISHIT